MTLFPLSITKYVHIRIVSSAGAAVTQVDTIISHDRYSCGQSWQRPSPGSVRLVLTASGTQDPTQKSGMPDAKYTTAEELAHPNPATADKEGR